MKYFFVEPVCYGLLYTPVIGVPTLIGVLEKNNYEAKYIGLNNDFISRCFDENFYNQILEKRNAICKIDKEDAPEEVIKVINMIDAANSKKVKTKIFDDSKNFIAQKIYKNKNFYLSELLFEFANRRFKILHKQLSTPDMTFADALLPDVGEFRGNSDEENFSININAIKYYFDKKLSPIDEYLEEQANKIISENPDCIGISLGTFYYFVPAMLLAYKIKQKSNIHVNIGGNFFHELYKKIDNLNEFFNVFFDSISIDDNTKTVTDLLKYINEEMPIEEVSNILYLEDGVVKRSKKSDFVKFKDLPFQSFTGYNLENLITPELILPIQASESCYWGKCIFCECCNSREFESKPVAKVVEEIEHLSKKYNTNYFYFWDNSMHPKFLSDLADLLLEKKLKIKFSIYARFEEEFNYKLLKKLKKAGCIKIHWGLDSANQRVLDYIKKGISLKTTEKVLKHSKKAGIYNFVYIILGHPTETKTEMEDLIPYLKRNHKNINNLSIVQSVMFLSQSKISEKRDENRALIYSTAEERQTFATKVKKQFPLITSDEYNSLQVMVPMLLYVEKYGNGFRTILNKKFISFMKSHPKFLSIYFKFKEKQLMK